jgi:probable phosphoglycerate mutase
MTKITIYTDGGARGNPGIAGAGAVIFDEQKEVLGEVSEYLGDNLTNNYAEYEAIVLVLHLCLELGLQDAELELCADSKLAVEQLSGRWKVKDAGIRQQFNKVNELMTGFSNKVKFTHVRRELNKHADRLANEAMDSVV